MFGHCFHAVGVQGPLFMNALSVNWSGILSFLISPSKPVAAEKASPMLFEDWPA